jgi:hypothetical protein
MSRTLRAGLPRGLRRAAFSTLHAARLKLRITKVGNPAH